VGSNRVMGNSVAAETGGVYIDRALPLHVPHRDV
jgi:hypothetical protein